MICAVVDVERQPALLRHIHERGHEVACHGQAHQMISAMTPDEVRTDVRQAKQTIEDAIGAPIFGYRAPTFSVVRHTLWALDILAEEGFTYDSSIFPIHHNRYGIPDAYRFPHEIPLTGGGSIVEFPMTTVAFAGQRFPFAGGGYFRLLPYAAIRAGLRYLNLHEMQPARPPAPLPRLSRRQSYVFPSELLIPRSEQTERTHVPHGS